MDPGSTTLKAQLSTHDIRCEKFPGYGEDVGNEHEQYTSRIVGERIPVHGTIISGSVQPGEIYDLARGGRTFSSLRHPITRSTGGQEMKKEKRYEKAYRNTRS
jgi:hypothetical protein